MTSCKDPELRRQVRETLLYAPKPPEGITPGQVAMPGIAPVRREAA